MMQPDPTFTLKSSVYDKEPRWQHLTSDEVRTYCLDSLNVFRTGQKGLHLQPVCNIDGQEHLLPWLDVEHDDSKLHHTSIPANIQAAQATFLDLAELELTEGVVVVLSGSAFRFMWPWVVPAEYSDALKAMAEDKSRWKYLDSGIQSNKNKFLRLFAWRNTKRQDPRWTCDRHLRMIPAEDLLTMTEQKYLALVSGPPDPSLAAPMWDALKPQTEMPQKWRDHLDWYKVRVDLRSTIVSAPKPPRPATGTDQDAIFSFLESQGIEWRSYTASGREIFKLSRCPICGESRGEPWVTPSGRLGCFRASCLGSGTTPPWKWVPDYQTPEAEAPAYADEGLTIEQARTAIQDGLRTDGDVLIRGVAGIGKTHAGLEHFVPESTRSLILYSVPTGELAQEIYERALGSALTVGADVRLIRGRTGGTRDKDEQKTNVAGFLPPADANCYNFNRVQAMTKKGLAPSVLTCPQCAYSKPDALCPYFRQFQDKPKVGLIITTHEKAKTLDWNFHTWIIDENPLDAFLKKKEVDDGAILAIKHKLDRGAAVLGKIRDAAEAAHREVVAEVEKAKTEGKRIWRESRLYATPAPPGQWEKSKTLWELAGVSDAEREILADELSYWECGQKEKFGAWQKRLHEADVDLHALRWLWSAVGSSSGTAYIRAEDSARTPIRYILFRNETPDHDCRLVALDATGDSAELDALFGRTFKTVQAHVALDDCRRVWIRKNGGKVVMCGSRAKPGRSDAELERDLKEALKYIPGDAQKIFLLTHMAIEDRVCRIAQRLAPDLKFYSAHFWMSRGLDKYRECDAAIAMGTPTINPAGAMDKAMALFGSDEAKRNAWIYGLGKRDQVQNLHRPRPIYGGKTLVVVGHDWPEEMGSPSFTLDKRRKGDAMQEAFERLKAFVQKTGFINKEIGLMLGIGTRADAEILMEYGEQARKGFLCVPTPIRDILIGVGTHSTPFRSLTLPRNGSWSELVNRLAVELDLPKLKVKLSISSGRWTDGVGYLSSVQGLMAQAGIEFQADYWQGEAGPPARQYPRPVPTAMEAMTMNIKRKTLPRVQPVTSCAPVVGPMTTVSRPHPVGQLYRTTLLRLIRERNAKPAVLKSAIGWP